MSSWLNLIKTDNDMRMFLNHQITRLQTILSFLFLILLNGCSAFSGSYQLAVTASDRELIQSAEKQLEFNIPLLTYKIKDKPFKLYKVAFDGTMNDAARVDTKNERATLVAHIAKQIGAYPEHYYPGPGMQNRYFPDFIDAMFGTSSSDIAEKAKAQFFREAAAWIDENPDVEIRVFVTGFSRGSAIARHFMNIVDRDWPAYLKSKADAHNQIRFYALLFDTVSTGQMTLNLQIPSSLDYLVHMVALDEPRSLFRPVIDTDANIASADTPKALSGYAQRINLVVLPGAHSDVGASYLQGIGNIYRGMTERLLYQMGFTDKNCFEEEDPFIGGKHDSRGFIDKLMGTTAPNSGASVRRTYFTIQSAALSPERVDEIDYRLDRLTFGNAERGAGFRSSRTALLPPSFKIRREGNDLKVLDYNTPWIDPSSFRFYSKDGIRRLDYHFLAPYNQNPSSLVIWDEIWNRLREGQEDTLTYGLLNRGGKPFFALYVNDILVKEVETNFQAGSASKPANKPFCN